jgi:DNA-binding PadR family transcriptional regulator
MPPAVTLRASPLAMTVLFMLMSGPIHPYEMQRRMKLWGKDLVVNVAQRATLYKVIDRLVEAGLIAVRGVERDQRFPERTVYELTEAGLRTAREWLVDMLAVPRNEFPRFPAALSFLMVLEPDQARVVLEQRAAALREQLVTLNRAMGPENGPLPPRVTLLDGQYVRMMVATELDWLDGVLAELRSGALSWNEAELHAAAHQFMGEPDVARAAMDSTSAS